MDALTALRSRKSIRKYESRPVPREALENMIDCARLAPSANGLQPWEFVVVTERPMLDRLAEINAFGKFLHEATAAVVVLSRDVKYFVEDCSTAVHALMVAAAAQGLGTCWIAGDKKPYADDIRRLVGAPEGFRLVATIAVGHPAEDPERDKRPLSEVLHWERF